MDARLILLSEKTFANLWKKDFFGENFHGLLAGATKRCHDPRGKLLQIATKPQNLQKFSPSKVFQLGFKLRGLIIVFVSF